MSLQFEGGKTTRLYSAELNNLAFQSTNGILSGCLVSFVSGLQVNISSGRMFFGIDRIDVSETNLTLDTNVINTNPRIDLIVIDSLGICSIIKGSASALPMTPNYNPETHIVLAMITIQANASTINAGSIRDIRVLNIGGGGSAGGGAFARYVEEFTNQTSITVTHNLADANPNVFIYDDSGEIIIADSITSLDVNSVEVSFSALTSGKVVILGGVGLNNGYYFREFSSALTWTVTHNLNNKYVHVVCYDSTDKIIEPQDIEIIDENSLLITFGIATEGKVSVTGGIASNDIADAMGVVVHGADGTIVRPSGYTIVTWIGSVEPTNMVENDLWIDNT